LTGDYNSNSFYGSFDYMAGYGIHSIVETGTGIVGLTYCDVPVNDPRVIAAEGYLVRDWLTNSGWRANFGNLYGMYGIMKACRLTTPPIKYILNYTGSPTIEWYNGTDQYADWLIANQAGSGSWTQTAGFGLGSVDLSTAWGILILEYVPVKEHGSLTVNVVDASTNNPIPGAHVSIDGPETLDGFTDGGKVDFLNILAGSYLVTAAKSGYNSASVPSDVLAGVTTQITIRLTPLTTPVGGFEAPLNTLAMLAPWIVLALAASVGAIVAAKRKRK
jgi:hypothetical protein